MSQPDPVQLVQPFVQAVNPANGLSHETLKGPDSEPRQTVRKSIALRQSHLQAKGQPFRAPPPEPTTCCGRGCNGCVWEGYEAALAWWFEESGTLLA